MLAQGKIRLEERVKAEMHQSVIEVGARMPRFILSSAESEPVVDARKQEEHWT